MIINECRYTRDSHLVNSTELKEKKHTYIKQGKPLTEMISTSCK